MKNPELRIVPLGDAVDVIGGGTPSKRNSAYYGGAIPWATVRDMNVDYVKRTEHTITEQGLSRSSTKVISAGEVIIATRVGLGKVCILNHDTAINQDLRGLVPKPGFEIERKYLFYWLKSIAHAIVAAGTGATVQGVKLPFIKALKVPLPPFEEQRRVVAFLDKAFESLDRAKANAEANLKDAREVFTSELSRTFNEVNASAERLERAIEEFVPAWSLAPVVRALQTLRGVDLIVAVTFVTEVGDVSRFERPRQLMGSGSRF